MAKYDQDQQSDSLHRQEGEQMIKLRYYGLVSDTASQADTSVSNLTADEPSSCDQTMVESRISEKNGQDRWGM